MSLWPKIQQGFCTLLDPDSFAEYNIKELHPLSELAFQDQQTRQYKFSYHEKQKQLYSMHMRGRKGCKVGTSYLQRTQTKVNPVKRCHKHASETGMRYQTTVEEPETYYWTALHYFSTVLIAHNQIETFRNLKHFRIWHFYTKISTSNCPVIFT